MNSLYCDIHSYLEKLPVISTHEHHLNAESHQNLTLDALLRRSYVAGCSLPKGPSREERGAWLKTVRANTYFVWLEKSISKIYGFSEINETNWDLVSQSISQAHRDAGFHREILSQMAGYKGFIQDSYWKPGCNLSMDGFAYAAYRIDTWMQGFHPDVRDHNGTNPRMFVKPAGDTLDAYEEAIATELERLSGTVSAFKCGVAYERDIAFGAADKDSARGVFGKPPSQVSPEEKRLFGDYIFNLFAEHARRLDIPLQIHTGLGLLPGSRPMLLTDAITRHPGVKFVLFHGGFPWIYETAALVHNYPNVYIDMCWLPIISTAAAQTALHVYLETLPDIGRISWGGDAWTSEESLGALMAFRHVLARVLAEKVDASLYRRKDTEPIAEGILYSNAQRLYKLDF